MIKVGIVGVTGYVGEELIRLLINHKEVEIVKIMSDTYAGKKYSSIYRNFTGLCDLVCEKVDLDNIPNGLDVMFTCLPYGVLMEKLTKDILNKVKIIDLGVDYRFMDEQEYKQYYGIEHKSLDLRDDFTYGLSEWNFDNIKSAKNIANPGCFAIAMIEALMPLVREDIIDLSNIIVDGKCSLSGAGKNLSQGTHFTEANESIKPYKIGIHPHAVEVAKAIKHFSGKDAHILFVPHIVPMQRGILISAYTKLEEKKTNEEIRKIYDKYYSNKRFVKLLEDGMYIETKWVKDSNMCHINFKVDEETNTLIVFAAIDNLIKGAAGQAIQNLNIMFGLDEDMGLNKVPSSL